MTTDSTVQFRPLVLPLIQRDAVRSTLKWIIELVQNRIDRLDPETAATEYAATLDLGGQIELRELQEDLYQLWLKEDARFRDST